MQNQINNLIKNKVAPIKVIFLVFLIGMELFLANNLVFAYIPTVDIKANNSDGPLTIPYNTSAILSWVSTNANSCYASGNWSGTKPISGSESTLNLTSTKTYAVICTGYGGQASDSVTIFVGTQPSLVVTKLVRNLSYETSWLDSVSADSNNRLSFSIKITAGSTSLQNVIVKDTLPGRIIYQGNLRIDEILSAGDIISGLNIGALSPSQTKTMTFDAVVAGSEQFAFGETRLINTVLVYTANVANSDTATIIVAKKTVPGVVPSIPTGFTDNIFLDFFFLPLLISLTIIWFFRFQIIKFEKWLDQKKEEYRKYRAEKILGLKIAKIKAREFFQKMKIK